MRRPDWDFDYAPVPTSAGDDDGEGTDLLVATLEPVACGRVLECLAARGLGGSLEVAFDRAPVHWYRLALESPARRADVARALESVPLRYVASARRGSQALGSPLDFDRAPPCEARDWRVETSPPAIDPQEGGWHLTEEVGIGVDRTLCGLGLGTRLAVIDDEAAESAALALDAELCVGVEAPSRAGLHGTLMGAWAVGCRRRDGGRFAGIAPASSLRLYLVPKPGIEVLSLAHAIARAAADGADVIVCATYVEGSTSPMLDDALSLAARLGRGGKGCVVVLPTGREASSPTGSAHASWTLGLGEPASDPRVLCVGPSSRAGEWFTWRDRQGRSRPFANRGPAVKLLAPGDDVSYPLADRRRPFHAESSGAAAMAAGAAALVLACNPELHARDVTALLVRTAGRVAPAFEHPERVAPLADPEDVRPRARDRDGHNAKHGYGRLNAARACIAASDPWSLALTTLGQDAHARTWARRSHGYSASLAMWAVRACLSDEAIEEQFKVIARHARLVAGSPARLEAHGAASLVRQAALLCRRLLEHANSHDVPDEVAHELAAVASRLADRTREPSDELLGLVCREMDPVWREDAVFNEAVPA